MMLLQKFLFLLLTVNLWLLQITFASAVAQMSASLTKSINSCTTDKGQHTITYNQQVVSSSWFKAVNENIIKSEKAKPSFVSQLAVANNKDDAVFLSQDQQDRAKSHVGTVGPEAMVKDFDSITAKSFNLKDFSSIASGLPQPGRSKENQNPIPVRAPQNNDFNLDTAANQLHKERVTADASLSTGSSGREGFWQRLKEKLDWNKNAFLPALRNALTIQTFAASPFSSLGQSGQNQLRVIDSGLRAESTEREARRINQKRDIETTRLNDIAGQGKAAAQERVNKTLEVMNETTELQESSLKSLEHICKNQRSEIPCWQNGNDLPLDLMFQLMGGNGNANNAPVEALELAPYAVWLHCPLPESSFTRDSEGTRLSGLLLEEKERLLLTVKSALPQNLHAEGCIAALYSEEGLQYFAATLQPEITERDNKVEADLALLKINTVHTEEGEDLADPETPFDDFINEYWPDYQSVCTNDPVFRIGDEVQLYGFDVLEEETDDPGKVSALNGLTTYITEESGVSRFTTNGEETFNGGLVARKENGCFKGLAKITVEGDTNTQKSVPINIMQAWLTTQNVSLPVANNADSGR